MRAFFLLLITLGLGVALGWLASGRGQHRPDDQPSGSGTGAYQCSMHSWVRKSEPGPCTLCGMALTPVDVMESGTGKRLQLGTNRIATMGVELVKVARTTLTRTLRVAGRVVEDETRRKRLAAYMSGRIEKLHVNFEGADVVRGQPLVTIYSPLLLEAEREYRLLYRQSQMNHSTKITAEHGRLLVAMKQRLLQYGLTEDQILKLPGKSDSQSTSEILSPMDGVVTQQIVVEGQYVEEGQLMLEIADLYTMWFEFDVYESDLPLIRLGQQIEIEIPGSANSATASTISFINPNLNLTKRAAEVRAELRNPVIRVKGEKTRNFRRQMYGEGRIRVERQAVLALPRQAILDEGDRVRVFVEETPGVYEARVVTIGFRGDGGWEVASGLVEGESVAANGLALLDSQAKL